MRFTVIQVKGAVMDDDDYSAVLRREFAAEEGSFLFQLHDLIWDRAAFNRLTAAMLACCEAYDESDEQPTLLGPAYDRTHLPRWLTAGFWFLATFVEDYTSHAAWKGKIAADPDYYAQAYHRLRDLADCFFNGRYSHPDSVRRSAPM
jgi:hypothetical protein